MPRTFSPTTELIKAEPGQLSVLLRELSDLDAEGQMAGPQDVDDAVVGKPGVEAQLLDLPSELPGSVVSLLKRRDQYDKADVLA